jgi:predicted acylesterase/phospholipase RssA
MKKIVRMVFKWISFVLLLCLPILMFTIMITMQVSKYNYDQMIADYTASIPQTPNLPINARLPDPTNTARPIRVLVMSGGGVHGLVQLQVIKYLEEQTGKPLSKLFDMVGCTSTGCLNLALLLAPDLHNPTKPQFSAAKAIADYPALAQVIFNRPWFNRINGLFGALKPMYSSQLKGLLLSQYLGQATLSNLLAPAFVCTTGLKSISSYCFESWDKADKDYLVANIVNAASSPPAVFYPVQIYKKDDLSGAASSLSSETSIENSYMDGAVITNDPSMQLLLYVMHQYPNNPIIFVNIGTAFANYTLSNESIVWSPLDWVANAFAMLYQAHENDIVSGLRYLVSLNSDRVTFYNIDSTTPNDVPMLSSDEADLENLLKIGDQMVEDNKSTLNTIAEKLNLTE